MENSTFNGILNENEIDESLKVSNVNENVKNEFFKKYKDIVESKDKGEIIKSIKRDILNTFSNVSSLELEILSHNIYYYACLIANNISEKEIINFISFENIQYYNKITDHELKKFNSDLTLKYIKYLVTRYIDLIKGY